MTVIPITRPHGRRPHEPLTDSDDLNTRRTAPARSVAGAPAVSPSSPDRADAGQAADWWENRTNLSDLWRFLEDRCDAPHNEVAYFLDEPWKWAPEYEQMRAEQDDDAPVGIPDDGGAHTCRCGHGAFTVWDCDGWKREHVVVNDEGRTVQSCPECDRELVVA